MPKAEAFFDAPVTLESVRPMCLGCHYWRESARGNCKVVRAMIGLADDQYLPDEIQAAVGEQVGLFGTTKRRPYCSRRQAPVPRKEPRPRAVVLPGQTSMFVE